MNEDVKRLWVTALRSGEYVKGKGTLHLKTDDGDRWCCLGVLCDLAVKAGIEVPVRHTETGTVLYAGRSSYLPPSVVAWAGFISGNDSPHVWVESELRSRTLVHLNDSHDFDGGDKSFEEIADFIETALVDESAVRSGQ